MLDVSCILINYNTSNFTINCIKSIEEFTNDINFEIVVVDNASKKEDFEILKDFINKYDKPNLKLFRSKINCGFGAGNMLGVQLASPCQYYAFINNDTLLTKKNTLSHLISFMKSQTDCAVCSPQMVDEHGNFRVTIDHFSSLQREILRRPLLESLFPKTYLNRKKRYEIPTKVHYVQGAFMFVDAEDFNEIGGFDTNLFLYYEESDLSRRLLKQRQKTTYLIPDLEYIHFTSASTKKNILIKIEQKLSLLYYIRKHFGCFQHKILLSYYIIRYFFSSVFKPKYWKLFFVFLKGAPISSSLKQVQKIQE